MREEPEVHFAFMSRCTFVWDNAPSHAPVAPLLMDFFRDDPSHLMWLHAAQGEQWKMIPGAFLCSTSGIILSFLSPKTCQIPLLSCKLDPLNLSSEISILICILCAQSVLLTMHGYPRLLKIKSAFKVYVFIWGKPWYLEGIAACIRLCIPSERLWWLLEN